VNGALGWVGDIVRFFGRLIPRLTIIPSYEGGVAFVRGKPRAVGSGCLVVWWPFWTQLLTVPVVRQTTNLPSQVITVEGEPLAVGAIVVWKIRDPLLALSRVHDPEEALRDLGLAAVKRGMWKRKLSEVMADADQIDADLKAGLAAGLRGFGIEIRNVFISDVARCKVLKLLADQPKATYEAAVVNGEEEP